MTAAEAWTVVADYAQAGGIAIARSMPPREMRRALSKKYNPRKAGDDNEPMLRINAAVDVLLADAAVRELCGDAPPAAEPPPAAPPKNPFASGFGGAFRSPTPNPGAARPKSFAETRVRAQWGAAAVAEPAAEPLVRGLPAWQTDPADGAHIAAADYTDLNFVRKEIHERSARFGAVETLKAWAWAGDGFRKVVEVRGNDFALEELGRALLYYQTNGPEPSWCRACFVTRGAGRIRRFQLLLLRMGRRCEDVSKFDWTYDGCADDLDFAPKLNAWLDGVEATLDRDRL